MLQNIHERKFVWFLFILTIITSLSPFFRIGFTTADDLENYMSYLNGTLGEVAKLNAFHAGRFYFLITKPIYSLPYIGDSFVLTKIIQNLSLLLSYFLFSVLIKKVFKSRELAYIMFLLLILATPVSSNYFLPFIAYPFYFTFSFSLVLISVLLFIKYIDSGKYKFVIFSSVSFFISILFYETYLIFLMLMCLYILFRNISITKGFNKLVRSKIFYKELIPMILSGMLYITIYFVFRLIFQSDGSMYAGSSFANNFSFDNFSRVITELTRTVFPLRIFNLSETLIAQNSILPAGHINNFWYILTNSKLIFVINTLIQIFLFVYLCLGFKKNVSYKKIVIGFMLAFVFAFMAHSILAISEKYNALEYTNIKGYVTSYYSYFGVWMMLLLIAYTLIKLSFNITKLKYAIIGILALALGYVSIITGYTNEHLSRGWEISQMRFTTIDELIKKGAFSEIKDSSVFYAPEMYKSDDLGYVLAAQHFDWGHYVAAKSQKHIKFIKTPEKLIELSQENPNLKIYRFIKLHTIKNKDFMFLLAEADKASINFNAGADMFKNATCRKGSIHYYSATKNFILVFKPKKEIFSNKKFIINDTEVVNIYNGYNQLYINNHSKNEPFTNITFESDIDIYTESFTVNNMIPLEIDSRVNLIDKRDVIYDYAISNDTPIYVESGNTYPMAFIQPMEITDTYSGISISVNLDININQKDKLIYFVAEIRDNKNEIIYWETQGFQNESSVSFSRFINLENLKPQSPKTLKFFLWNPNSCKFTITKINNTSIKII